MINEAQTSVKPTVLHIQDLFTMIGRGGLRIPRFQRPYVWSPQDMTELLESIVKGYPIGNLLFWDTDHKVQSSNEIGPHKIPAAYRQLATYVLDGHQRLATLYGVLRKSESDDWVWRIYYDLEKDRFLHHKKNKNPPSHQILLSILLSSIDFFEFSDRIRAERPAEHKELIEKAQKLVQLIQSFRLPVNRILGGSLEDAVNIFARVNKPGRRVSIDQMAAALTYSEGAEKFDLAQEIDGIQAALSRYHFADIDRDFILRAILAAQKKDLFVINWKKLSAETNKKELKRAVGRTKKNLIAAARFLAKDLLIPSDKFLPYAIQLVFIGEFFGHNDQPNENQLALLRQWFWVTSFSGWFGGVHNTKIHEALDEIRKVADGSLQKFAYVSMEEEALPFPERFDPRSARVRAYTLFLLHQNLCNLENNKKLLPFSLLREHAHRAFAKIDAGKKRSMTENRILLGPDNTVDDVLEQLKAVKKDSSALASHGITTKAFQKLKNGDLDSFFELRRENLIQLERDFMKEKGVKPADG